MGSSVSSISGTLGSIIPSISNGLSSAGGSLGGGVSSILSPSSLLGQVGGIGADALTDMINKLVPAVPIADQTALNKQIAAQQGLANTFGVQQQEQQNAANTQYHKATGMLDQGQSAINNAQGAVGNAQQVNQGPGSNVNSAVGLLGQTAAGSGAAQQAARAQLQAGTDQVIASQHALANSGNLSQQIGSQKAAMDNAAQLQQQNALNASMLQAGMAGSAQGQYAGAAGQQASQAAQNAVLQQAQTAAQQQQTAQQTNILGQLQNQAIGYAGQANTAQQGAAANQLGGLGIQQDALGQTSEYRAKALGGAMNAGGGAAALASDKDLKKDVKDGKSTVKSFLDALDSKTFEYKESDNKEGKTPGMHMGVIAQQVEKAPGGKAMIVETSQGKGIDLASAVGTLLAAAAESNNRIKELEALYKSRSESRKKK
jgi:hypothetical protein